MIRKFFKNAGMLGITELILRLKGFIFIPLLTRHFGALNYGVWAQVGVLMSTIAPLAILGTDSAVLRVLPGLPLKEQKRSYSAWLIALFIITSLLCGSLYFFKRPITETFFGNSQEYMRFLPLVAATLFVNIFLNSTRNWFRIQNNAKVYAAISIAQSVLGLVAVIIMLVGKKSVYELVIYNIIVDLLIVLALLIKITREFGWSIPDYSALSSLYKFGLPLVPTGYAMWALNYLDRVFLVKYSTMEEIGVYSLVFGLGYIVIQTLINPIWLMYPSNASASYDKGDMAGLQKLFSYSAGLVLALGVPSVAGLLVLGKPIITILATSEFIAGAPLIALITGGYLFLMVASFFDVSLGLVHRQYLCTVSMACACGINIILNFMLIPRFTILGAAAATCLAFFSQLIISFILASRYKLLAVDFSFVYKILGISFLMGLIVQAASLTIRQYSLLTLLLLSLLGVVVYAVLLMLFGVVTTAMVKSAINGLRGRESPLESECTTVHEAHQ